LPFARCRLKSGGAASRPKKDFNRKDRKGKLAKIAKRKISFWKKHHQTSRAPLCALAALLCELCG
jgi:hypothetical protein